jgi:hypothetical protein
MSTLFDAAAMLGEKAAKEKLPEALALLAGLYRDALASAVGADDLVLLREREEDVAALAAAGRAPGGLPPLRRALRAVLDADEALAGNMNAITVLDRLMMNLRPCERLAAEANA